LRRVTAHCATDYKTACFPPSGLIHSYLIPRRSLCPRRICSHSAALLGQSPMTTGRPVPMDPDTRDVPSSSIIPSQQAEASHHLPPPWEAAFFSNADASIVFDFRSLRRFSYGAPSQESESLAVDYLRPPLSSWDSEEYYHGSVELSRTLPRKTSVSTEVSTHIPCFFIVSNCF
jgi:hypothetical protein